MSTPYPLEIILTPNKPALADAGTQPLQVLVRLRPQQDPSQVRTPISLAIVIAARDMFKLSSMALRSCFEGERKAAIELLGG